MQGYTTISVKPGTKKKIKLLKEEETYTQYLDQLVNQQWEDSEYDEEDLEIEEEEDEQEKEAGDDKEEKTDEEE